MSPPLQESERKMLKDRARFLDVVTSESNKARSSALGRPNSMIINLPVDFHRFTFGTAALKEKGAPHVGLTQGTNLTQPVAHHFAHSPPSLLILDNPETIWEPRESRVELERFLALLADVDHLALIILIVFKVKITMRGAERPANIRWTHPFSEPLKPLALDAAPQTFIDIADNGHTLGEIDKILLSVDNMPLAIDLIAHLVDCEGYASVLDRWDKERTSLLSKGHDRGSNLDLSISLSRGSSRMLSMPESRELLSLLSILPDGLSATDLVQSKLPIDNILACKTMLLATSLAYTEGQKRLKALVPIREYIHKTHSPTARIVQPLRRYFRELEVYETYHGTVSIQGQLEVYFSIRLLVTTYRPIPRAQHIVDQALESFPYFDDPDLKCRYYDVLAIYFCDHKTPDTPRAINLALTGRSLAISTGNIRRQSDILSTLALLKWTTGDYSGGQKHAYESQRLAKISGNSYKEAWALNMEAMCWYSLGNYTDSIPLCKRARDLLRFCGMSGGRLDHYIMGSQAEIHQLKSGPQHPDSNIGQFIAQIDVKIGVSKHELHKNIDVASQLSESIGYPMGIIWCDIIKAALDVQEADFPTAKGRFQKGLTFAWGKDAEVVSYSLERLGNIRIWTQPDHVSYNVTVIFLVYSLKLKKNLEIHKALQFLAEMYFAHGDQQTALSLLVVALDGFTHMDVHRSRAESMLRQGDIVKLQEDIVKAGELWKTAQPLFKPSSQQKQITHIDEMLAGIVVQRP
ncbi:hypothetical protein FB451DRAFT_1185255 [Mycena latifolia]|nr:hypothetical protein FB451DRAFT_1185255 [Mycena latifolia]